LVAEFPSGYSLMVCSSSVNEYGLPDVIRGHHATLHIGGANVDLKPEAKFSEEIDPESFKNLTPVEDVGEHQSNWIACVRSGKLPNANIELAVRVQTIVALGEMSDRLGIACHYDEKSRAVMDGTGRRIDLVTYGTLKPS
jgi:hypothetical protein